MTNNVSFPGLGINININNVAFTIFGNDVYWYGVIIALGIATCVGLAMYHSKKNKFSADFVSDVILCALPCAFIGARLYYVLCEWEYYKWDIKKIINTRNGGLAVYGGIIGAFLAVIIMCKIRKIKFASVVDYCVPYIPLGQAIGRWGNFFNQEAFGTTTKLPWGMTSPAVQSYLMENCPELDPTMPVHPTFLYESLFNFALFLALLYLRKRSKHDYETMCGYFIGYGIARFLIEGLRTDSLYIGNTGIRTSQLLSIILVVAGVLYICYANYKNVGRTYIPARFLESSRLFEKVEDDSENEAESENVAETEASEEAGTEKVETEEKTETAENAVEDKKE